MFTNYSAFNLALFLMNYFIEGIIPRMIEIMIAPFVTPKMFWIVLPLLASMILMQLYFGRHREEELGWNTAFGNSVALIFVSVNLLQLLYNEYGYSIFNLLNPPTVKIWPVIFVAALSISQMIINFFHLIPKRIAFFINSATSTNLTAYFAIVFVYTNIPIDFTSLITSFIILTALIYLFKLLRMAVPMSKKAAIYVEMKKRMEEKKKREIEIRELRQERAIDAQVSDAKFPFIMALLVLIGVLLFQFIFSTKAPWTFLFSSIFSSVLFILITKEMLKKKKLEIYNLGYDGNSDEAITGTFIGIFTFLSLLFLGFSLSSIIPLKDFQILSNSIELYGKKNFVGTIVFLISSIIGPIGSELLFRGFIQRSLKPYFGIHKAVILQSLMWCILNINVFMLTGTYTYWLILNIIPIFFLGIILGYVKEKWALDGAITSHICVNVLFFTMMMLP